MIPNVINLFLIYEMEWDLNPLLLLMNYDEIFSEQINELCCLYKNEITETINLTYDKVSIV